MGRWFLRCQGSSGPPRVLATIASAVAGGTGLTASTVAGCADATDRPSAVVGDAGVDATAPFDAAADATAAQDAAAADAGPHAKLVLVNGSPNAPALRFCFGAGDPTANGTVLAALPAAPDDDLASTANGLPYPGVFVGSGASAPDPQTDWSQSAVAIYAIDAERIRSQVRSQDGSQANCRALVGVDGAGALLTLDEDFWYLGSIPEGTMANGTAWLSAIVGCLPGITDAGPPCDPSPDGSAPAMGALWELDNSTTVDPRSIGAQFANASFATVASASSLSGAAGFALQAADGGAALREAIATDAAPGTLEPQSLAVVSGLPFDGSTGFFFSATRSDGGILDIVSSFTDIQRASWGLAAPDGAAFATGGGYVFVLVGDPTMVPDGAGAAPGRAGHLLAFPTAPPFGSP